MHNKTRAYIQATFFPLPPSFPSLPPSPHKQLLIVFVSGEDDRDTWGMQQEGDIFLHYIFFCTVELKIKREEKRDQIIETGLRYQLKYTISKAPSNPEIL